MPDIESIWLIALSVSALLAIVATLLIVRRERLQADAQRATVFAASTEGEKRCPHCGMGNMWTEARCISCGKPLPG